MVGGADAGFQDGCGDAVRLGQVGAMTQDPWFGMPFFVDLGLQFGQESHRVRNFQYWAGCVYTTAGTGVAGFSGDGGQASAAKLNQPRDVTFGDDASLYIADEGNHRIRKVAVSGVISTVAGSAATSFSGDNGPATSAGLVRPTAVAVDDNDNLFIADLHRIRRVDATTGIITTIAGNGTAGSTGDGGVSLWICQGVQAAFLELGSLGELVAGEVVLARCGAWRG